MTAVVAGGLCGVVVAANVSEYIRSSFTGQNKNKAFKGYLHRDNSFGPTMISEWFYRAARPLSQHRADDCVRFSCPKCH